MYIKDMNFIDNLNTIYLNNIDKNEIDNFSNLINLFNNFNLKNEILYNSNKYINKHERFKVEKSNSTIFAMLINNKKFLDYYNININKALRAIMTLTYTLEKQNCDIKLQDRYICENSDLSRSQLYNLLRLLDNKEIIKYFIDKGEKRVKALTLLKNDPLIIKMNKELYKGKISAFDKCLRFKNPGVYYNESTYLTKKNHLKQNIINITLAYNELLNIYSESNREDIKYIIIPIPLISDMLHIQERKIKKIIKNLTKSSWLKPHNLVYVNTFGMDHYFNDSYKWFNKRDWRDIILEEGHPVVNEYSYIIFKDPFKESKWYKNYKNYKNDMIEEVKNAIISNSKKQKYYMKRNKYFNEEELENTQLSNEINEHSQITNFSYENDNLFEQAIINENYKATETIMNEQEQKGSIINLDIIRKNSNYKRSQKPYMINDKEISELNIKGVSQELHKVQYYIEQDIEGYHLKYYCKLFKKLQNHLKQIIRDASTLSIKFAIKVRDSLIKSNIGQDIDYEFEPIKDLILHYPTTNEINKAYFLQKSLNKKYPDSSNNIRIYQNSLKDMDNEFEGIISEEWLNIYEDNIIRKQNSNYQEEYKDITTKEYIQELKELFI